MKMADHTKFHEKWEHLQKKLGLVLSLAHYDTWISVDTDYTKQIDEAIKALNSLKSKNLYLNIKDIR